MLVSQAATPCGSCQSDTTSARASRPSRRMLSVEAATIHLSLLVHIVALPRFSDPVTAPKNCHNCLILLVSALGIEPRTP